MPRQNHKLWLAGGGLAMLLAIATPQPRATVEILTHRPDDAAPARLRAALDLGLVAISVLVTWSRTLPR